MQSAYVHPVSSLQGNLIIPGDKSISHRAIIFAAISEGKSRIHHLLESEDVLCTIDCFRALGVPIHKDGNEWVIQGVGLRGLKPPTKILYCGNSGTTLRLMLGVLSAQPFETGLSGDASLSRRPLKRVMDPLSGMGASFRVENEGEPDRVVWVRGRTLNGIQYQSPVASAQVKSAILLAGLWAKGSTSVKEPSLSRDHSERMLQACGVSIDQQSNQVVLQPPESLHFPLSFQVPGDISSAAFFLVAGLIVPNAQIRVDHVGLNSSRTGILEVLQKMGGKITITDLKIEGGEEVGSLWVHPSKLIATHIAGDLIPKLIDEIPILSIAAARAVGTTNISDAAELRVKESDRIHTVHQLLEKLGVVSREKLDGLVIQGGKIFRSSTIESFGDHRIAMSAAIAGLVASSPLTIQDIQCVQTSFPSFWESLIKLGGKVEFHS